MTIVFQHPVFGDHEVPPGHVEREGRYLAVAKMLSGDAFAGLERREAPVADLEKLKAAHGGAYVDGIAAQAPRDGMIQLDPDTFMGPHSLEAARRGAGGAMAAVDAVFGSAGNAFVASRPPGHHTTPDRAMGFCLFNNVAVAAQHARASHGITRVAVVDFDVHHGNGTQDIFWNDENAFFASSHEWPQYPGTGRDDETGIAGNCHNVTIASGEGGRAFRRAWGDRLLPALDAFGPEIVIISAGFDAHTADPVGGLDLVEDDFRWITGELMKVADTHCEGRIVSVLEGGYDLDALARSVAAHVETLAGE